MHFIFGDKQNISSGDDNFDAINVKSLEHAIKIFKVQVLFPEGYVYPKYIEKNIYHNNYSGHSYHEYILKEGYPEYYIPIFEGILREYGGRYYLDKGAWISEITLSECINVDYSELIPKQQMLSGDVPIEGLVKVKADNSDLLVIEDKNTLAFKNKVALREMTKKIRKMQLEMEIQKNQLREEVALIQKELDKKLKAIYILETFLGVKEEVIRIKEGEKAPDEEPLTLYQQLLYMDEEIGIWEDDGLDWKTIDVWDEWILKNYENFLYKPKSICAFQVRRHKKEYYGDDFPGATLLNNLANQPNFETYFLIRNGENLYRIWSDVHIKEKLFPTETEYNDLLSETRDKYNNYLNYTDDERAEEVKRIMDEKHSEYMYGFIAIQGLIERTDIFNNLQGRVNLIIGKMDESINLVRDAEREFWLKTNMPTWKDYVEKNRKSIGLGTRIIISARDSNFRGKDENWRTDPFRPWGRPGQNSIFTIEKVRPENEERCYDWDFLIRYNPKDEIYPKNYWEETHERKRRVPFRLYKEEVLNFDTVTIEDIDYYEQNRLERPNYLHILPVLHYVKKVKQEEEKLELEFVKLVASSLRVDLEEYKERIMKVVRWWKLKNKWKRALTKDESKALRMVSRRVKSVYNIF